MNTIDATLPPPNTNAGFAARANVHFTMASRLRSGARSPSLATLLAAYKGYGMSCDQLISWLEAVDRGSEASGAWLREHVFANPTPLPAGRDQLSPIHGSSDTS